MKSKTKLLEVYNKAKGDNKYYTFDNFLEDAKLYIKTLKKDNTVCSMQVSKSGMTRRFNFLNFNMLFNICYKNKFSWDNIKVSGCGMDMHWYLKFSVCEQLYTKAENEKYNLNNKCSSGTIL